MHFSTILPFVCATIGLVRAADFRLVFIIPANEDMATFEADFANACPSWAPAEDAGLTLSSFVTQPGDFGLENKDTQIRLSCVWTDGTTKTAFTKDVAASLGATLRPSQV
ncbi:hypothetical protein C8J57DRAFT_1473321 [Mycena rebaudengoi]|nr:hypothetical protein C8J57DRAFT_1473321 [Mycena rebaudengoi]